MNTEKLHKTTKYLASMESTGGFKSQKKNCYVKRKSLQTMADPSTDQ